MGLGRHIGEGGSRGRRSRKAVRADGRWLYRQVRGLRPDRNPLRRRTDRVESYLLAGLFVAAAASAPLAVQAASQAAHAGALRMQQEQRATRYQAEAVLTRQAGSTISGYTLSARVPAEATWPSGTGTVKSGEVLAPAGSPKGTQVTVWVDAAGDLTSPPLADSQVSGQANAAAVGALAGVVVVFLAGAGTTRYVLYRRRMAAWDADWRITARAWNHQSW